VIVEIRLDPVVTGSGIDPEKDGDVPYRPASIDLGDRQGAAVNPGMSSILIWHLNLRRCQVLSLR